jgi:hypothetical protein
MAYQYHLTIDCFKKSTDKIPLKRIPVGPIITQEPVQYGDSIEVFLESSKIKADFGEVYQRRIHATARSASSQGLETNLYTKLVNADVESVERHADIFAKESMRGAQN